MIARSKTKTTGKTTKPALKVKPGAARPKSETKAVNKKAVVKKAVVTKSSFKKSTTSKGKPAKAIQKPGKSQALVIVKKEKLPAAKKNSVQKGSPIKSKESPAKIVSKQKASLSKMLEKKPKNPSPTKPSGKSLIKPIAKPLIDSAKKKLMVSAAPKANAKLAPAPKLAPPPKLVSKPAASAPIAKLLAATKPIVPPRPIVTGPPTNPKIVEKIRGLQETREQRKDLAQPPTSRSVLIPHSRAAEQPRDLNKDRLILMVRDPFWLHACWDITRKSVERAKAALAGQWHTARPVLRLLKSDDNSTTSNTENVYRDIEIHGAVRHWYIETESQGSTFRLLLGYMFGNNRFHELARSNPVMPPIPGSPDSTDDHWADLTKDADRVYALSGGHDDDSSAGELQQMMQEKLKRPIGNPSLTQFGSGAEGSLRRMKNFHLELDAEIVVFGTTHPLAVMTVGGEPVSIRSDGTFSARVPFPNNRQVLAATSKSRDGLDEQTIVLAVERNTKIMEPLSSSEPDE